MMLRSSTRGSGTRRGTIGCHSSSAQLAMEKGTISNPPFYNSDGIVSSGGVMNCVKG